MAPNTARARRKPPRTILAGPELPRSEGALTNDHRNHRGPRRVPDYWYPLRRGCPARRRGRTPGGPRRAGADRPPHRHESDRDRAVAAAAGRRRRVHRRRTGDRTVTGIEAARRERRRRFGVSDEAVDAEKAKLTRLEATNPEGTPCPTNTTERKDSAE